MKRRRKHCCAPQKNVRMTAKRSCSAIGASCWEENHPGSGTDIELCVAASATSGSVRPHSAAWPLHGPAGGAAVLVPPEPTDRPYERAGS